MKRVVDYAKSRSEFKIRVKSDSSGIVNDKGIVNEANWAYNIDVETEKKWIDVKKK